MLMRADKPDEDDAGVVMDFHNETVVVAFNVEDDAIVGENISGGILDFDLVEIFPVSDVRLMKPGAQCFLGRAMLLPESAELLAGDNVHSMRLRAKIIVPILGTVSI